MKKEHFNPKSKEWLASLLVMLVLCVIVIFGSIKVYNLANSKYYNHISTQITIDSTKALDISALLGNNYNVTAVEEAYDKSGTLVAYIVTGKATGYNAEMPIEMSTVISADGQIVYSVDILEQNETEYLGARIVQAQFKEQFNGRYLPVVAGGSTEKGSPIDTIAKATISSKAVIDGVNNAKDFCISYIIAEE